MSIKHEGERGLVEVKTIPQEFRPFTPNERSELEKEGVSFISLTEDIKRQNEPVRPHTLAINGVRGLLQVPLMITEFAIFSDPWKVFVADGQGKNLARQRRLAQLDSWELSGKDGLGKLSIEVGHWHSDQNSEVLYPVRLIVARNR